VNSTHLPIDTVIGNRHCGFACIVPLLRWLFLIAVFAVSGNTICALGQQNRARPVATKETGQGGKTGGVMNESAATGPIKGRVVGDDGRPINNATVTAWGGFGEVFGKATRVDPEGRFVFGDLPAAAYRINATAPGYIDQSLMQDDPLEWSRHLIGTQVRITMIKGGVITGTVTNSRGDVVVGAPVNAALVNALRPSNARMSGLPAAAETDDRGIYRIYGLPPGQYTVAAGGGGPFGQVTATGFDLDVPTFYPSATRDTAVPVIVRGEEETTGIDIKYRGVEGHLVSGIVTSHVEIGTAITPVMIGLAPAGTVSILSLAIANTVDQRRVFSFNGVADGDYDLLASFQMGPNQDPLLGTKRVTVSGGDVSGIEVKLGTLGSIAGTLALDPIKPEGQCDKRASQIMETVITAPRDEPKKSGSQALTQIFGALSGSLNAKGEFTVRNLEAGKYRLAITLPTEAWYIRAITPPANLPKKSTQSAATTQRPVALWQGILTLKSGERLGPVSISVGQGAASLRGHVITTSKTAMPAGLRVHLVPGERERVEDVLRYSETPVKDDGGFAFTNLAPGRYFVVARIEPFNETQSAPPRLSAWEPASRINLRREAEAANTVVELKPCERLDSYTLVLKPDQF
jgi:Carboxypeptidase regulatory-like domain